MSVWRVVVLVDNRAAPGLGVEHGFSVWIEGPPGAVLFDTGQGTVLEQNARRLGIDWSRVSAVVLSHGHYDHAGGLGYVARVCPGVRLYAHPAAWQARWIVRGGAHEISAGTVGQSAAGTLQYTATVSPLEVLPGVHVTGPIPRQTTYEDAGGPFFLDREGLRPDLIPDDQALWLDTGNRVTVILGCAHAGVVNTLEYIRNLTGGRRIEAVMGGMHLGSASPERIAATCDYLAEVEPEVVVPCHCTGEAAVQAMRQRLGARVQDCRSGLELVFPAAC